MIALHSQAAERKAHVCYCNTYSATEEMQLAWYGENDSTRVWILYSSGLKSAQYFDKKEYFCVKHVNQTSPTLPFTNPRFFEVYVSLEASIPTRKSWWLFPTPLLVDFMVVTRKLPLESESRLAWRQFRLVSLLSNSKQLRAVCLGHCFQNDRWNKLI
jgi:hypothetical protein